MSVNYSEIVFLVCHYGWIHLIRIRSKLAFQDGVLPNNQIQGYILTGDVSNDFLIILLYTTQVQVLYDDPMH